MARQQVKVIKWKVLRKRTVQVKEWESIVEAMKAEKLGHGKIWKAIKMGQEINGHIFTAETHLARKAKKKNQPLKPGFFDYDTWAKQYKY
ncbi:hypothetical protein [Chitinophaga sp. YIM B06452]|uniref:hypothetical protein n=1 Tax=Chitinophaga sp. YIM B06452 TaxID=3082158 RepID=UPI0031FE95AB